jgi:hypothetical protein
MDKSLISYIDNSIIGEYAYKIEDGLCLYIDDLDNHEQENLISRLFAYDPVIKELILDRAQELINQRLPFVESKNNYNNGLYPSHDKTTGEVKWFPRLGA